MKTKLLNSGCTRWVARIDGLFVSVVKTLFFGFFCLHPESKVNSDTVSKSQALLNHLFSFSFIVTLVVTRKIFDLIHSVSELVQAKLNDIVLGFHLIASLIEIISSARINIDFLFGECYKHALELAQKVSVQGVTQKFWEDDISKELGKM